MQQETTPDAVQPPPRRDPFADLRPMDVSVLCAHFGFPTPTPDTDISTIVRQRGLTAEDLYDQLSGTTSVPLMVAAHALVTGPRRLPPDPRLNPAPLPPCGPQRAPLRSGEVVPKARYTKPARTAADPIPTVVPPDDAVLVSVAPNPKKPGSRTWDDYARYAVGQTVGELRKMGWRTSNLAWDIGHGFVVFGPAILLSAPAAPGPETTLDAEQHSAPAAAATTPDAA